MCSFTWREANKYIGAKVRVIVEKDFGPFKTIRKEKEVEIK